MTTRAHIRKTALSFPQVTEEVDHSANSTFSSGDDHFARVNREFVELFLPKRDRERVLEKHSTAERLGDHGVRVPLGDINGQQANHWLRRAWLSKAPNPLAEQVAASDSAVAGEVGDLPREIGNPATRALVGAGITSLSDVARHTDAELRALHGIGPRAIRILKEALSASGREFRS